MALQHSTVPTGRSPYLPARISTLPIRPDRISKAIDPHRRRWDCFKTASWYSCWNDTRLKDAKHPRLRRN
jgi:hypothetical protein